MKNDYKIKGFHELLRKIFADDMITRRHVFLHIDFIRDAVSIEVGLSLLCSHCKS